MRIETLSAGSKPLATWRAIYFGAGAALDPAAKLPVEAGARVIDAVVAAGAPVYGVNTGFGKLASVRIDAHDLTTLQRNIVLSHCVGVGEPLPVPVTRLMMALKLASLAQGASGIRWSTLEALGACLAKGLVPIVPAQGSRSARPATSRRWPTWPRRSSAWASSTCAARACRRPRRWPRRVSRPSCSGPRKAWRS